MESFALSEVQAQAILDMRLQKLTGLEREKVVEEYKELMALIERLRAILASDQLVLEEIRKGARGHRKTYGDPRAHGDHSRNRRHHHRGHDRR